jgi:hypothetical protein
MKTLAARYRQEMMARGVKQDPRSGRSFFSGYGEAVYDWELYLESICLAYWGSTELTINGIRLFLDAQHEDGFIPRRVVPRYDPEKTSELGRAYHDYEEEEHCKPFLFQAALIASRISGDGGWLTPRDYKGLARYLEHWIKRWDRDGNGLSEWASGPHSGADTQFERIGPWRSTFCEGVDLNSYLVMECMAAAEFGEKDRWLSEADARRQKIRTVLWDDGEGMFFDRDARDGSRIPVKAGSTFLPLWAGVATPDQARRLVREHLTNPAEFWTPYPVSSYARSEKAYTQLYKPPPGSVPSQYLTAGHCNWCGGMWPHWDYLIAHGLQGFGFAKEAAHVAERFAACSSSDKGLSEWYDAETGEGRGMNPFFAGASVLGVILPAELSCGLDPTMIASPRERLDLSGVRKVLGIRGQAAEGSP